jgi:hypothetical protein
MTTAWIITALDRGRFTPALPAAPKCCIFVEGDDLDARRWEIIENLHRAELTVQQRADWTAELVKLCEEEEVAQVGPLSPGRGKKGGVREAARELGKPRSTVQRDLKIAATAPEAKEDPLSPTRRVAHITLPGVASSGSRSPKLRRLRLTADDPLEPDCPGGESSPLFRKAMPLIVDAARH